MEEVSRYKKRHFLGVRLLGLISPGAGHLLGGRTLIGCLLLALWLFALSGLILRGRVLIAPEEITISTWSGHNISLLTIALLAWLFGNLSRPEARRD